MRTALVTGAGRNIGAAIAHRLLERGDHRHVATGRDADGVAAALEPFTGSAELLIVAADLGVDADVDHLCDRAEEWAPGGIDVLINNAVQRTTYAFDVHPVEEFRRVLEVSVVAPLRLMQRFIPGMAERGWGRVVNMGGLSAQTGTRGKVAGSASKAAVAGMTRTIALEVADRGVTVNTVSPGPIDTERGAWTSSGDLEQLKELYEQRRRSVPVGRWGGVDEVVALCEYLISDRAGFMTGQNLSLNGGLLMP